MRLPVRFWTKLRVRLFGIGRKTKRRQTKEHPRWERGPLVIQDLEPRQLLTTVVATALPAATPAAIYASVTPGPSTGLGGQPLLTAQSTIAAPALTAAMMASMAAAVPDNDLPAMPADLSQTTAGTANASPAPGQADGPGDWGGGFFGNAAANFTTDTSDGLPILHSLPGAPTQIYLDFTGWTGYGYGGYQSWAPYDTDGNPGYFDASEQKDIAEGWRRVAAYFSAFDIDVTTVQPTDNNYSWIVISPDVVNAYSYLAWGSNAPSGFVAQSYILDRTSALLHEAVHNFSLKHQ